MNGVPAVGQFAIYATEFGEDGDAIEGCPEKEIEIIGWNVDDTGGWEPVIWTDTGSREARSVKGFLRLEEDEEEDEEG